ncbi:MAG: lipid-A-disaccharide synthase [Thermodesulfobacteriota bacterium]|nr:lipid-A-disaccharide synthase [Thermodesulfobacteriota bacterium]
MFNRKTKIVLIIAGEASADLHGANLVRAMKRMDPTILFWGIGGKQMANVGVKILIPSSDMAVVGLTEVLSRLHRITRAYIKIKNILKNIRPDLIILIDYPDFNLRMAHIAKRNKVPVLYYISPQVWAWRKRRINKIAKRVDRMAVILPFEKSVYRKKGIEVEYVGHPIIDSFSDKPGKNAFINEMGLKNSYPVLGLLPGSRIEEIKNLLPLMIKAVELLSSRYKNLECVLPVASTVSRDIVKSMVRQSSVKIMISEGNIHKTLAVCDLAIVTSGTATLETALMEVPMIIVYRVSPISFLIAKMIVKVSYIGLVNLVAGEKVVPELIQKEVTPIRLSHEAMSILEHDHKKKNMINKLKTVKQRLGRGSASERTAKIAIEMMRYA